MKLRCASVIFLFLLALPAFARSPKCMFRVHAEANVQDTEVFASSVKAKVGGQDVAIQKIASISEADVAAFTAYQDPDGSYGALLMLDEHGRIALDTLSVEQRGRHLFVFVNGRMVTEFVVDKRVSDGKIYIARGLTAQDLKSMKASWKVVVPKPAHR